MWFIITFTTIFILSIICMMVSIFIFHDTIRKKDYRNAFFAGMCFVGCVGFIILELMFLNNG